MKKITLCIVFAITAIQLNFGQSIYKRVQIQNTTTATLQQLDNIGIDLTCGALITEDNIQLELSQSELERVENEGLSYNVLIEDLSAFYSERAEVDLPKARLELIQEKMRSAERSYSVNEIINNTGQYNECDEIDWAVPVNWNLNPNSSPNSFGGCLTYSQVLQELDDMRTLYPNLISARLDASPTNQTTIEGRTVWYIRISDNPDLDEAGEPETLYTSLVHSREAATIMNQLFFMWYLLENYATDTAVKNLVDNHALYFIPVFNPDGFVHNQNIQPNGGGLQRKNRNISAGSCGSTATSDDYGVDLNRNSQYYYNNGGSSSNPCNQTYRGTTYFSEPETQIMRDFFLLHDFKLALNHHSFKNAMLHAYAGTTITNPRPDEYSKYNHDMTYYNRYAHGPSTSISALNSGNMNDWMLGGPSGAGSNGTGSGKNTMAWTPENGTSSEAGPTGSGFWPAPSNYLPIARRAMRMNFLAAYFSGKYAKLHDFNQNDITSLSGNLEFAIENLGQEASDFTLTVTPVSSNILSVGAPSTQSGMSILQQNNVSISYSLDPGIQPDDEIEFKVVLTNDYASGNVLYEANITKQYNPTVIFTDNPDTDNLTNWTPFGGSWSTTSDAYSGSTAITSTPTPPYSNGTDTQLQMNGTVDFSNASTFLIQFYAKWDLERSFDYVQLEGSNNGSTWTPLCGKLTKPGAPNANNTYSGKSTTNNNFQPDNEPLYDGDMQDRWSMEEIVVDGSSNAFLLNDNTVYLRFNFQTDGTNRQDSYYNVDFEGFTFDDFKIVQIEIPCVESVPTGLAVSSITATTATADWDLIPSATYDLRYRVQGSGSWTDVLDLAANSYNFTSLTASTDYEVQVRSKCGANTSAYTSSVNFSTPAINYCASTGNAVDGYLTCTRQVIFNTINNSSPAEDIDYSDFTGISTSVERSSSYDLTVNVNTDGNYIVHTFAWIDWNGNGLFTDAGEEYDLGTATDTPNGPVTSAPLSIMVPATANLGTTRMRISTKWNGDPSSCENGFDGEVEDYTLNITDDTLSNPSVIFNDLRIYPNPFNDSITLKLGNSLSNDSDIELTIFDISGRIISKLNNMEIQQNTIVLRNLQNLSNGTYFLQIKDRTSSSTVVKPLIKH